jgi:hypothetical protein
MTVFAYVHIRPAKPQSTNYCKTIYLAGIAAVSEIALSDGKMKKLSVELEHPKSQLPVVRQSKWHEDLTASRLGVITITHSPTDVNIF